MISSGGGFLLYVIGEHSSRALAFPEFASADRPAHDSPQIPDSPAAFLEFVARLRSLNGNDEAASTGGLNLSFPNTSRTD